jgi:hypothetical protein
MRMIFCILCVAMGSGIAGAQQYVSNFDACVSEATQKHADATMDNYSSYSCDGATAQKLAVKPDACSSDVKPTRIERKSRQLSNGLYLRMVWRTRKCAGMCEIRFYDDSRDGDSKDLVPSYRCEVRRHNRETREAQSDDPPPRRYRRAYPYDFPPPRRTWRPVRDYDDPEWYGRRRLDEEDARHRWIYRGEWYQVYPRVYRDEYRDVYRDDRGDYRGDDRY